MHSKHKSFTALHSCYTLEEHHYTASKTPQHRRNTRADKLNTAPLLTTDNNKTDQSNNHSTNYSTPFIHLIQLNIRSLYIAKLTFPQYRNGSINTHYVIRSESLNTSPNSITAIHVIALLLIIQICRGYDYSKTGFQAERQWGVTMCNEAWRKPLEAYYPGSGNIYMTRWRHSAVTYRVTDNLTTA